MKKLIAIISIFTLMFTFSAQTFCFAGEDPESEVTAEQTYEKEDTPFKKKLSQIRNMLVITNAIIKDEVSKIGSKVVDEFLQTKDSLFKGINYLRDYLNKNDPRFLVPTLATGAIGIALAVMGPLGLLHCCRKATVEPISKVEGTETNSDAEEVAAEPNSEAGEAAAEAIPETGEAD